MSPAPAPAERFAQAHARLSGKLPPAGFVLPGSITERWTRCGTPGCRCRAETPVLHGPYPQWTRKVDGKTVTRLLTEEQARHYRRWIDNGRKLREMVRRLEELGVQAAQHTEGWS